MLEVNEATGNYEQAIAEREQANVLYGRETPEDAARQATALKEAYAREGPAGYWKKTLALASQDALPGKLDSYELAAIYARLGEKEKAFDLLNQACQERNNEVLHLNEQAIWDDFRFRSALPRDCSAGRTQALSPVFLN